MIFTRPRSTGAAPDDRKGGEQRDEREPRTGTGARLRRAEANVRNGGGRKQEALQTKAHVRSLRGSPFSTQSGYFFAPSGLASASASLMKRCSGPLGVYI